MSKGLVLVILLTITLVGVVVAPFIGMTTISWGEIWSGVASAESDIFWRMRVPRVCLAFLVGATLSISGLIFQALFRNFLASPFTLGVSSAASLGAALYFKLGLSFTILGLTGAGSFALVGSLGSISLMYALGRSLGALTSAGLLLAGMALSLFFSSLVVVIQYAGNFSQVFSINRWLMGSLDVVGFHSPQVLLPGAILVVGVAFVCARELNLLSVDEDFAVSRGVSVSFVRMILFFVTSIAVAMVVSLCGVIGFVGIIAPHICRLLVGIEHRRLVVASTLFGGIFLVMCDVISRTIVAPAEIPIGVVTSVIGAPLFILLLVLQGRRVYGGMSLGC